MPIDEDEDDRDDNRPFTKVRKETVILAVTCFGCGTGLLLLHTQRQQQEDSIVVGVTGITLIAVGTRLTFRTLRIFIPRLSKWLDVLTESASDFMDRALSFPVENPGRSADERSVKSQTLSPVAEAEAGTKHRPAPMVVRWPEDGSLNDEVIQTIRSSLVNSSITSIREEYGVAAIERTLEDSTNRLNDAIQTVGARTTKNLLTGTAIAVVGMFVLWWSLPVAREESGLLSDLVRTSVGLPNGTETDRWALFADFLPRFSFVVVIELFAFFFLRLYSAGLQELKYYQNELTNIDAYRAAIHTTIAKGSEEQLQTVVNSLVNVDRNATMAASTPVKGKSGGTIKEFTEFVKEVKS